MAINAIKAIKEDLIIEVGLGVTQSVGSDSYAYYISEILPKNVIGLYRPACHFDKSWADGEMKVADFDPTIKSSMYIKRRYGHWWNVKADGTPISRFTGRYCNLYFGHARAYRDPSF